MSFVPVRQHHIRNGVDNEVYFVKEPKYTKELTNVVSASTGANLRGDQGKN